MTRRLFQPVLAVFGACLLLSAPALAADPAPAQPPGAAGPRYNPYKARWTVLRADATGGMAFDPASLDRDDKTNTAILATLVMLGKPGALDGKPIEFLFVSTEFDCKSPRRRDGVRVGMGPDFKPVGGDDTLGAWQQVNRDTFAGQALLFACKGVVPAKPIYQGGYIDTVLAMRKALKRAN